MNSYEDQFLNRSLQSKLSTDPSFSFSSLSPLDTRISTDISLPIRSNASAALIQSQSQTSHSGIFTVSSTGVVKLDYLSDGGAYKGELGIFRWTGMEQFAPGSADFRREAARRSLSNSNEGYVVISDLTESAQYSDRFQWESDYNSGRYMGVKTLTMTPGDQFAIMLVPDGTIQEVFNNPNLEGAKRPLFSIASANPATASHFGGIKNVNTTGQVIGIEDLREDGDSDIDFNDIIFYVEGATGSVDPIDSLIFPGYEWRSDPMGQQLLAFTPLPGSGGSGDSGTKTPTKPEDDPTKWNISFVNFNNATIPSEPDFTKAVAFSIIDVQRDQDGSIRFSENFGDKSPAPNVQSDYFGLQAWTRVSDLDPNHLYEVTTQSDDGTQFFLKNVKTGETKKLTDLGAAANGDWRDRSSTDPAKNFYFKVPEQGDYDLYVQYYDKTGNAALNVTFGKAVPFQPQTPVDKAKNWQADVFWLNGVTTKQPPAKVEDLKDKLGTIDLGSNSSGIQFDFGQSSPNGDSRLPSDNFVIVAYTEATFDGTYTFRASGDDGFQIYAKKAGEDKLTAITPVNQWQQAYNSRQPFTKEIDLNGKYELYFAFYEQGGDAKLDLSWTKKVVPSEKPRKYNFSYFFDPDNREQSDSYRGYVYAYPDQYKDEKKLNPNPNNNEIGKDGRYVVFAVPEGEGNIEDAGKVVVESYYDSETDRSYKPIKILQDTFSGLGSEYGFINSTIDDSKKFGLDSLEYDLAPKDSVYLAPQKETGRVWTTIVAEPGNEGKAHRVTIDWGKDRWEGVVTPNPGQREVTLWYEGDETRGRNTNLRRVRVEAAIERNDGATSVSGTLITNGAGQYVTPKSIDIKSNEWEKIESLPRIFKSPNELSYTGKAWTTIYTEPGNEGKKHRVTIDWGNYKWTRDVELSPGQSTITLRYNQKNPYSIPRIVKVEAIPDDSNAAWLISYKTKISNLPVQLSNQGIIDIDDGDWKKILNDYELIEQAAGVALYTDNKGTYVQSVDLSAGASLKFLQGSSDSDGENPKFPYGTTDSYWKSFKLTSENRAFSITNGSFFEEDFWNPLPFGSERTALSFPIKANNEYISLGADKYKPEEPKVGGITLPRVPGFKFRQPEGRLRTLNIFGDTVTMNPFRQKDFENKEVSAPNAIVGFNYPNYSGGDDDGKTFIAMKDSDLRNGYETLLILNSRDPDLTNDNAVKTLASFITGNGNNDETTIQQIIKDQIIVLDSGGSTTLATDKKEYLVPKTFSIDIGDITISRQRQIPQAIGILSA